jgi:hypothetical protein
MISVTEHACGCSHAAGPCDRHSVTLVTRTSPGSGFALNYRYVLDVIELFAPDHPLSPWGAGVMARARTALLGGAWEDVLPDEMSSVVDQVDHWTRGDAWTRWTGGRDGADGADGYVIVRPADGSPLVEDDD